MVDSTPRLDEIEFANTEQRLACVLLVDTSSSMSGDPIQKLNDALGSLRDAMKADDLVRMRVEVAVVSFGDGIHVVSDFATVDHFTTPVLTTAGLTPMGEAVEKALDMIESRKAEYKQHGIMYYRPWIFMITDGEPQGEPQEVVQQAISRAQTAQEHKHVTFFAIGVENANEQILNQFTPRTLKLRGLEFEKLFEFLSNSFASLVETQPGDQVRMRPPDDIFVVES